MYRDLTGGDDHIDHIPAQIGFKLLSLFKLTETDQRIT
ncbi:hypothetical protein ACUOFC_22695, partial [Escherichia sp. TWPC-MK]